MDSVDVIIFGDDDGAGVFAAKFGFRHVPDVECSKYGYPLVSAMFKEAERLSSNPFLAYVNSDIVLWGLPKVAQTVRLKLPKFLLVGHRRDLPKGRLPDFGHPKWWRFLRAASQPGPPCAIDYFLFTRGLFKDIPPFAVGHVAWDNWMIESTLRRKKPVVDATNVVQAFHLWHKPRPGHRPDKKKNLKLFGGNPAKPRGFITHSNWVLDKRGLRQR